MRHFITVISSLAFPLSTLLAQGGQLEGVSDAADRATRALRLDGAGLSVVRAHQDLHQSLHRNFAADQVLPIASASEWLAVATVLTLVDEGKLDLDHPVARYIEEFDRDDRRRMTLRQCLSCMSGLPSRMGDSMGGWDMQRFATEVAGEALRAQPGSAFRYGGVGFQVAAVAAVRVSGKDWHTLFAERIGKPLGMKDTAFGKLSPLADEPGTAALPWVASGAVSTLNDYTRFVRMLLAKGEWEGQQVLSETSVAAMLRDQVPSYADVKAADTHAKHARYGLGTWIESLDRDGTRLSNPGDFGFTPWVDQQLEIGGVFAVQDQARRVLRNLPRIHKAVRTAVTSPAVAGTSETIKLRHDGRTRRYHLHVPPEAGHHEELPLLVVLHSDGSNGVGIRDVTKLDKIGLEMGFVVVFPDGTGRLPKKSLSWNCGGADVYASRKKIDDVDFLKHVVSDIQKKVSVDMDRVFAVGHSNGGMMCHRLARDAADVFDGIAVVAGAMNFTERSPSGPLATLLVHGTRDKVVQMDGGKAASIRGEGRESASLQDAVDYYVHRNGLVGYPSTDVDGGIRVDQYDLSNGLTDSALLWVVTLDGGGHAWPGSDHVTSPSSEHPYSWPASRRIATFFAGLRSQNSLLLSLPAAPR